MFILESESCPLELREVLDKTPDNSAAATLIFILLSMSRRALLLQMIPINSLRS